MKTKIVLLTTAVLISIASFAGAPPVEEGKTIFTARCASCHNINKTLTGPALAGVDERRSMDWIISFVKSSQSLVKAGDKDAVAVFEKFNKIPMPDHADLTDENIKSVVEYIKSEGTAATAEKAPFAKPTKLRPDYKPVTIDDYGFFIGFFAVVGILIASLLFAVQLKEFERGTSGEA